MTTVTGTVGGQSVDNYVRATHRVTQLCNPLGILTITLGTNFPGSVTPSQAVVIYENSIKTFTGYVVKITRERPSHDWVLECHDAYTRCSNYFIDQKITVGYDSNDQPIPGYQAQSSDYWIGYLCGLAGIDYSIDSGSGGTVPPGVQIGLRTVHESLQDIQAYSCQTSYIDADGVLHFIRVTRNNPGVTLSSVISVEDGTDDSETRNQIKVYGYASQRSRVFSNQSVSIPGITPNRITAIASPMIQTQAEADRIGSYLLGELGAPTKIVTAKIDHNPNLRVGQVARIQYGSTNVVDAITGLSTRIDEENQFTEVTVGERCPRIAGWSQLAPVYCGTSTAGIYKSLNGGISWGEFNTGLPVGNKYVSRIATNFDGDAMAIVNGALFYNSGLDNDWLPKALPSPINSAGDSPAPGYGTIKAVTPGQILNKFYVMTVNTRTSGSTQQNARTWLYETTNAGTSWTSTEMNDTSGSGYHFIGLDMSSEFGQPYILGSSGSAYDLQFLKGSMLRQGYKDTFGTKTCADLANRGILDFDLKNWSVTGAGTSQVLHVTLSVKYDIAPATMFLIYRIYDNTDNYFGIDVGPWTVAGSSVESFSANEVSFTIPYREAPFMIGLTFDSVTSSGFDTWYIRNSEPRSCSDVMNEVPSRYYIASGFLGYTFA